MKKSDLTILIQGPIRNDLLHEAIPQYKKFGKVLFVHWPEDNIETYKPYNIDFHSIVPISYSGFYNFNNTFLQVYGIYIGLQLISTPYTIRVRSDECFPDLSKFIKNIEKHSDKFHFSNLYSFKDSEQKYCLGNHIFGGKTQDLLKAYAWQYMACHPTMKYELGVTERENKLYITDVLGVEIEMWSEILNVISMLHSKKIKLVAEKSTVQMNDHFYITPLREFPDFKWTHKYNNYQPITEFTQMEYDPKWEDSYTIPNRFITKIEEI